MFKDNPDYHFLDRGHENWDGVFEFDVVAYASSVPPDLGMVTSVRAILTHAGGTQVLFVRDPEREHILPGGRRESGESLEATLHREIQEETGWTIKSTGLLGFLHFHHRTPKPEGYKYPYPDFCQFIYVAQANEYDVRVKEVGGYELSSEFVIVDLQHERFVRLSAYERAFLLKALQKNSR
jgi:ADP-ribose pyrophosphatase YjhB (NUDIX family)